MATGVRADATGACRQRGNKELDTAACSATPVDALIPGSASGTSGTSGSLGQTNDDSEPEAARGERLDLPSWQRLRGLSQVQPLFVTVIIVRALIDVVLIAVVYESITTYDPPSPGRTPVGIGLISLTLTDEASHNTMPDSSIGCVWTTQGEGEILGYNMTISQLDHHIHLATWSLSTPDMVAGTCVPQTQS